MDGGSAPTQVDPAIAAQVTADGNLKNLNAQTVANRPNQVTPWGTSTWTQTPTVDHAGYDAATAKYNQGNSQGTWVAGTPGYSQWSGSGEGGSMVDVAGTEGHWSNATSDGSKAPTLADYTNKQWTQNLTLSPAEQAALSDQQSIQQNQSHLAQTLQGQVADTMKGGFKAPSLADYMKNVGSVNQQFGGFTPQGVGAIDQSHINVGNFTAGNQDVNQNFGSDAQHVDLNAPQFNNGTIQRGAQAAFNSATGLLMPQMQQDTKNLDTQLRLQGLTPGTEAYNTAAQNLQRTQNQSLNQIANQSVLTGNQMANTNYASALAGYGARNTAIGQQYGQDTGAFTLGNQAKTQALQNSMLNFQGALQGQTAHNTTQNQAYTQALAGYGANQSAQQQSNFAQQQAHQQALGGYSTAYTSALQNYLQPLNNMNAVLGGQQVNMPSMPSFATAGYTNGADMTGAANAKNSMAQGMYNSDVASANSTNAAGAGAIAAIAAAFI